MFLRHLRVQMDSWWFSFWLGKIYIRGSNLARLNA
jgi:hypothetical protein